MSKTRDALVAVTFTAVIVSGYVFENRPRSSHAAALRDLYRSPVCLSADGSALPGSPTVATAWERTIRIPLTRTHIDFIGLGTIELRFLADTEMGHLTFIDAGADHWHANDDVATSAWVRHVCGFLH